MEMKRSMLKRKIQPSPGIVVAAKTLMVSAAADALQFEIGS